MDAAERLRSYRRYVSEAGGVKRADGSSSATVDEKILEKERKTDFEISRLRRFRYRTRYFSDSGIIGTKFMECLSDQINLLKINEINVNEGLFRVLDPLF